MVIPPFVPKSDQISGMPFWTQLFTPLPTIGNVTVLHLSWATLFSPIKLKSTNQEPPLTKFSGLVTPTVEKSNELVTSIQFIDGVKVSDTLLTCIDMGFTEGAVLTVLIVIRMAPVLFILTGIDTSR